ncbi:hypothetical protein LOTGIDRAFT_155827 [Lottia gigantea]|uniref:Uncharacterized protein n=1 Tax=Lottia gigantea TaxID=225164 RepID=V3ZF96_LOTGI|nr:hypothetical protein LOTGIDRAFT_155827 [Lottia gigantea]ESO82797.1 hypothetical protein LOTGIDRAFT_155827 [Lottia gigantea]
MTTAPLYMEVMLQNYALQHVQHRITNTDFDMVLLTEEVWRKGVCFGHDACSSERTNWRIAIYIVVEPYQNQHEYLQRHLLYFIISRLACELETFAPGYNTISRPFINFFTFFGHTANIADKVLLQQWRVYHVLSTTEEDKLLDINPNDVAMHITVKSEPDPLPTSQNTILPVMLTLQDTMNLISQNIEKMGTVFTSLNAVQGLPNNQIPVTRKRKHDGITKSLGLGLHKKTRNMSMSSSDEIDSDGSEMSVSDTEALMPP